MDVIGDYVVGCTKRILPMSRENEIRMLGAGIFKAAHYLVRGAG